MSDRIPNTDRRSEPRFISAGRGDLTILTPPAFTKLTAFIQDVSKSGIQLKVDEPLEAGTSIELRLKTVTVWGEVGNCRPQEGGYRVGIRTGQMTEHQ